MVQTEFKLSRLLLSLAWTKTKIRGARNKHRATETDTQDINMCTSERKGFTELCFGHGPLSGNKLY